MIMMDQKQIFLPCVMGPTGAGKTAASLTIAGHFSSSVINADSRQIYRDFPIITAQPSHEEQAVCTHLLFGFLPTDQKMTAGSYARLAKDIIDCVREIDSVPLLVGGTGLYFQALLEGIAPIPPVKKEIADLWQERCKERGSKVLHRLLCFIDPDYAKKIHPNDKQRITRALEVWQSTGETLSWWHKQQQPLFLYHPVKIGIALSLEELAPRLKKRIDQMIERGALEEAKKAFELCKGVFGPGWSGIGCQEIFKYLTHELSWDSALELWLKNTRAYAKRQLTWFKRDRFIRWFAPHETEEILSYVLDEQKKFQSAQERVR